MWQNLATNGHWKGELWNIRRTGEEYAVGLTISAILNETNVAQNYVGVSTNITQAKKHEEKLAWLVFHDEKTGFPNLRFIIKNLSEQISTLKINELLCIAYIDIDKFKIINDRYGTSFGDIILKRVGKTLTQLLSVNEVFARLNGDEFVLSFKSNCPEKINKRLETIKNKITLECSQDISLVFTVSIGVTLYPQLLIRDSEQLIRQADQAMYTAKLMGGDQIQYFDLLEEKEKTSLHQLINEIRHAIDHDEFILFYQPKINTNTYEIIGAEALIRWQHPERGLLSPAAFLPLVEHDDIIEAIGIWVLNASLDQLSHWLKLANAIPLSINISPRELHSVDFFSNAISALKHYQHVDPSLLEFEVMETSALEDIDYVSSVIMECRKLGIEFAIDDFGTGYSSLTYLKHLPVDIIKIDQSFIRNITHNSVDQAILKSIIDLANILNRKLIAEGIETQQHLELLKEMGCNYGQGYAIGRPMPIDEFEEWSRKWLINHG